MSYKRLKPIKEQDEEGEDPELNYVKKMLSRFEDTALLATSPNLQRSISLPNSPNNTNAQFFNEILRADAADNLLLLDEENK